MRFETVPAISPTSRADLVRAEQIGTLYNQTPATYAGVLIAAILLMMGVWGHRPPWIMTLWFLVVLAQITGRFVLFANYRRAAPSPENTRRWGSYLTIASLTNGCIWGAAGLVMYVPDALPQQALLTVILYGVATGSLTLNPMIYPPSFNAFIIPTLTPIIVRTMLEGDYQHSIMAAVGALLLAVSLWFGRNLSKVVIESLNRRFENLDLITRLTEQKAFAEKAQHEAEAANRTKSQFLAAASHDLRQPLHALGLFTATLNEKLAGQGEHGIVNSINASIESLESLFDALLDISKLDAGVIQASIEDFPLQTLFDQLQSDFASEAHEKGLRLVVRPSTAIVRSDPTLLGRILANLVSNAIRYTEKGRVVVGARRCGETLRIEVWDTGTGIPAEYRDKVFEEFYQLNNPERDRKKGLGLGLAIVRRLTDLLKLKLEVRSTPRRGSVFRISAPRGEAGSARPTAAAPVAAADNLRGKLIVVVDDELSVREGMQALLAQWGCEVVNAGSADEALQALAETGKAPDVVLADYRLRGDETGIEAIRAIETRYGDGAFAAVLITGDTAPDRLRDARASGYQLLHKPVRPAKLRALLSQLLQTAR